MSYIFGSILLADGKVFIGNKEGEAVILKTGRKMEKLGLVEFSAPVYASPVIANGVLYIASQTHLYAFEEGAKTASK